MANDPHGLGQQLGIDVESILCPHCDSELVQLVRVLAPDELEGPTVETWKNTTGGAGLGGAIGAIGGPPGVAIGAVGGAVAGAIRANNQKEKARAIVDCPDCGHYGDALGNQPDSNNHVPHR